MNKHYIFTLICTISFCATLHGKMPVFNSKAPDIKQVLDKKIKPAKSITAKTKATEKKIWFRFKDEPLVDIVNYLASEKKINVVLPAGKEAITQKLTFQYQEKITLDEAWQRLLTFLKISGFTVVPHNDFYFITGANPKTNKDANRESYPLYSHVKPSDLPDSDEKIRYLHYFSNLQVGAGGGSTSSYMGGGSSGGSSVSSIIQALLSKDASIITDPSINGIVITDYARNIASVMEIITELDSHGFTDAIDIFPLKHTVAATVSSLFQKLINPSAGSTTSQFGAPATSSSSNSSQSQYFAKTTRIIPESRTNSLIIMGKKDALTEAKSFIKKHIDIPLGTGESVLHIYDLQYLQASTFKTTLQSIVSSSGSSTTSSYGSQSSGSTGTNSGEQYFKGVIIEAETTAASSSSSQYSSYGGSNSGWGGGSSSGSVNAPAQAAQSSNRLVIAARREDWIRIKKLIEELDKPMLQVAIEVLIVDLSLSGDKLLASQIRNKQGFNNNGVNFQTNHAVNFQLKGGNTPTSSSPADALMGDLFQNLGNTNFAGATTAGSLILSLKDTGGSGMWFITQLLNSYKDVKVLSQPFIVALNNQSCSFSQDDTRLLPGDATVASGGGAVTIAQQPQKSTLKVGVTPLISHGGKINLGINITIQEYGDSNTTLSRQITTNANINDGEVLILGGLTKTKVTNDIAKTPGLADVPLLGWLFKKKQKVTVKENLFVFMCPRIITTHVDEVFDPYTKNKMTSMNEILAKGENFETLKDPITHWFFGSNDNDVATKRINAFNNKHMYNSNETYKLDRYNTGARTITLDATDPIDRRSIRKIKNLVPPPPSKKLARANKESNTDRAADFLKVEKKPVSKIKLAKAAQSADQPTSEEQEFKNLFAQLQNPVT
jgi:general secretion pathway protein D